MYCKFYFYDLAKDLMSENFDLCSKLMEADDLEYVQTLVIH